MIVDIVCNCHGYEPYLNTNKLSTWMVKYTMDLSRRGYNSIGFVGYMNDIFHSLCFVARILYLRT